MKSLPKITWRIMLLTVLLASETELRPQVPQMVSYQGRLTISGTNFTGTGHFKFALVNPAGSLTFWSNDGTSVAGGPPMTDVALPVTDGLFSVLLGDPTLAHMTKPVPASVFTNNQVQLRIWVSDRTSSFQQLAPDQRFGSAGYALQSAGAAVAYDLAPGVVTNIGTVVQLDTGPGLTGGPITSSGTIFIPTAGISNAMLQNSSVTVSAGSGLSGGGTVVLGGSTALAANVNHNSTLGGNGGSTPLGINLSNANTWVAPQAFSSTILGNISGTASGFSGVLAGDVIGTQSATVITNLSASKVAGLLRWQTTTGTAQQASPNTGYIVTNSARVVVTLPVTLAVGDVIALASPGAGGWRLSQNVGQSIFAGSFETLDIGLTWVPHGPLANWRSIACSSDATKAVAVVQNGQIYTSTDAGVAWTPRENARVWSATACSADGTRMLAAVNGGQIYVSPDLGANWLARDTNRAWSGLASSADGTKLAAVANGGLIYISIDSGTTWQPRGSSRAWSAIACSADGTRLVAVVYGSQITTSTDSGTTWSNLRGPSGYWGAVASSTDGRKLVMASRSGQIYTSTDSGTNWVAHGPVAAWYGITSSADGSRLGAVANSGQVHISTDSGLTWTARESNRAWQAITGSSDGTRFLATVASGQVFVATPPSITPATTTTPGTSGYLTGGQGTAIQLLYIGDNRFLPLSHEGAISAF